MTSGFESLETINSAARPENNGLALKNTSKTSQEEFSSVLDTAQKSYDLANEKYLDNFSEKNLTANKVSNPENNVEKFNERSENLVKHKVKENEPEKSDLLESGKKAKINNENKLAEAHDKKTDKKEEIKACKLEKENIKGKDKPEKPVKSQEETEKELLNDRIKLATSINLNLIKEVQQKTKPETVKKENLNAKNVVNLSQNNSNVVDIAVKSRLQVNSADTAEKIDSKDKLDKKSEGKNLEKAELELNKPKIKQLKVEPEQFQAKGVQSEKIQDSSLSSKTSEKLENIKIDNKAIAQELLEQKAKIPVQKKEIQNKEFAEKKAGVLVNESQLENINPKNQENNVLSNKKSEKLESIRPEIEKIEIKTPAKNSSANTSKEHDLKDKVQINFNGMENLSVKLNPDKDIQFSKILETKETVKSQLSDSVMDQIKKASVEFGKNKTEIELTLRPNDLGKVEIKLISENGILTAQIKSDNPQIKEILGKEIETLRQNLTDQGITVNKITVQESNPTNNNQNSNYEQDLQKFDQKSDNAENQSSFRQKLGYNTLSESNEYFGEENIELTEGSQIEPNGGNARGKVDYRV